MSGEKSAGTAFSELPDIGQTPGMTDYALLPW